MWRVLKPRVISLLRAPKLTKINQLQAGQYTFIYTGNRGVLALACALCSQKQTLTLEQFAIGHQMQCPNSLCKLTYRTITQNGGELFMAESNDSTT
jgi:hypothetical protein